MNTKTPSTIAISCVIGALTCVAVATPAQSSRSVGFQHMTVDGGAAGPIEIGMWYPTSVTSSPSRLGLYTQDVAIGGSISGERLPMVVISHGSGGSLASHYDTALELARANFLVVALTHPGDNSSDQSAAGNDRNLVDRPQHVTRVLDYMLREWPGRFHIDSTRIGMFGASLGGFTGLLLAGGKPDFSKTREHCVQSPSAPECRFVRERHGDPLAPPPPNLPTSFRDSRIRSLAIAVPALGFLFAGQGLAGVNIPVQVWRAENDSEAPNPTNSDVIVKELPPAADVHTVPGAGHFVFIAPCSAALLAAVPVICNDAAGVDRTAVHATLNAAVVRFFADGLGAGTRRRLERSHPHAHA